MAPAKKSTTSTVFLALSGSEIDSAHATLEDAKTRVAELKEWKGCRAGVERGNYVTVIEAPAKKEKEVQAKAAPKKTVKKKKVEEDEEEEEDGEEKKPAKKKTKSVVSAKV